MLCRNNYVAIKCNCILEAYIVHRFFISVYNSVMLIDWFLLSYCGTFPEYLEIDLYFHYVKDFNSITHVPVHMPSAHDLELCLLLRIVCKCSLNLDLQVRPIYVQGVPFKTQP
jgi:hypothetical protein